MGDNDTCDMWTTKPLEFDYRRIYQLCEQYVKLTTDYERYLDLCEKHSKDELLIGFEDTYQFFFNCTLNDLHREMSLWKTKR